MESMDLEKFFEEETDEQEFSIDFRRYLRGMYKRKWIVLGIFLVILVPWLLYVRSQPPEYEAYTWIRFKNYDPEQLQALNNSWFIELTSRTFAERVVAQLGLTLDLTEKDKKKGLMRQDVFKSFYTDEHPVPGKYLLSVADANFQLYRLSFDEKHREKIAEGSVSEITNSTFTVNGFSFKIKPEFFQTRKELKFIVHNFRSMVKWFRSHVRVDLGRGGTLMQVSMVHENPIMVAQMVNRLAEIFVEESISFEKKKAREYKQALQNRLKTAQEQLRRDQEELKKFKETHFISLDTDIQKKVDELSALEAQKKSIETSKENLVSLLAKIKELGNPVVTSENDMPEIRYVYSQITKNALFKNNTEMGILGEKLSNLEKQRKKLLETVTAVHPDVKKIDQQINEVYAQILILAKKELKAVAQQLRGMNRQMASLKRSIRNLPSEQLKLANLSQKVEISKKLYSELLAKSQEMQIAEAADSEEIDILDPAIPPDSPKNRGKKKKAMMGIFFAFFMSIGTGIFLEFMDKTIKTEEDIKKYLKLEVIGTIPKVHFDEEHELNDSDKLRQIDSQLVTYDYSPTPIGEAYRALRTKIVFSKKTGKLRSLVITSFAPGDGKSFTSSNLAVTLAQHKSNTLLIDADLRRGVLHNTFGLEKEPGLSNYLIGMVRFEEILQETHVPNLTLVSCGSMMPNPSELLGSVQLQRFVEEAKRRFDIILFDTPPLNAATDAVVLGTQVDGVVLIARAETTNRNVAKQKLNLFENVPANILGVVLNGAEADLAHEGYSYYHY